MEPLTLNMRWLKKELDNFNYKVVMAGVVLLELLEHHLIIFLSKTFLMGNHGGLFQGEMGKVYH